MTRAVHTLMPGDVVCAQRGERLETLLGSCVAIVMTDRLRTVGAMCHIVHCRPAAETSGSPGHSAEGAIDTLYQLLRGYALNPSMCEAWIFGGGNMFPAVIQGTHVGERNGDCAKQRLAADGVRVIHEDLGGPAYRRLGWTVGPDMPEVVAVPV